MNYGIAFTPLVPSFVLWVAIAAIAVITGLLLLARSRGWNYQLMGVGFDGVNVPTKKLTMRNARPLKPFQMTENR